MYTHRYAAFVTLLTILLIIALSILGTYASDWHRDAREYEAMVDTHTQELKAIGRFDTVCMSANGKLLITLSEHSTSKLDLACMRGSETLFRSNTGQME